MSKCCRRSCTATSHWTAGKPAFDAVLGLVDEVLSIDEFDRVPGVTRVHE